MSNLTRNFTAGRMNKLVDQRLVPNGEYINALNVRMGSTEQSEMGVIENTKGNLPLTDIGYIDGTPLSIDARCIGAFEDGSKETVYWFVHDPNFPTGATGKLDLIMSFNTLTTILTYHVISIDDGGGVDTTLNFNPKYLITAVNKIDDLLFFSDDYNPPRWINVTDNYANPASNIDQFSAESLLVVKKPPIESPTFQLVNTGGQQNFLKDNFICFAYRYRYADSQYSATSQFSLPAFMPGGFDFSPSNLLNNGMQNSMNTAIVTYNSGGPLVVGIDLLFKDASNNIIKVIEKLNKADLGLLDNTDYTYTFSNSKIFTILPDYEILRLYDNVPRLAKAQTIMGNRLMYGNYLEGYDLLDKYGNPVNFQYYTDLISEDISLSEIYTLTQSGNYNIDGLVSVSGATLAIDLSGVDLVAGAVISFDITLNHDSFSGSTPFPTEENENLSVNFSFILPIDYASVFDMATSASFQEAIGTISNIQPMATACDGVTMTDIFNCALAQNLNIYTKYNSGITAIDQPILIVTTSGSNYISFQFPAAVYVDNVTTPTYTVYEYFNIISSVVTFQKLSSTQSLHSNRGYEIGIVYMDEFNRSSTALVSKNNTINVPCGNAKYKNYIQVTIPSSPIPQIAPEWATRYKFVIKPDREGYDTIYSNLFFNDPLTSNTYFLLEGENARKVEIGMRLVVKSDTDGPTDNCVYATVLDKQSEQADFLTIPSSLNPSVNIPVPSGVYMKLNPNNFNAIFDEQSVINPGTITAFEASAGFYPNLSYPLNYAPVPLGPYIDYTVPQGSRIVLSFKFERKGTGDGGGSCERRIYTLNQTLISSANYNNMKDWWDGDNVEDVLNTGTPEVGGSGNCPIGNVYDATLTAVPTVVPDLCNNKYQIVRDPADNYLYLYVTGTRSCGGSENRKSSISVSITVYRNETTFIFETEPSEANPDIFFESDQSFAIDSLGNHEGNVLNQDLSIGLPAIINTSFFNCYSFGNGAESYKILDSIVGDTFNLGNRVTAVANEEYKAARRSSDITYSGVYNNETNVNKLNEFNLGLLNFKPLQNFFGPIYILDARQTDVLVLQEDKISYVLAGKNLLSDAAGGGAVTSVPEVLGTQIARTEKYGISFNPESYIHWGYDRYFTDAKRGAVIQLKGGMSEMDQLSVISEDNMSTWFRDLFITDFNTQKLGAYDPYLDEYVLSSNNITIPTVTTCLACGVTQEFTFTEKTKKFGYCVNVGQIVGDVEITYNVISLPIDGEFFIDAEYDGNIFETGIVNTSGTLVVDKNSNTADTVSVFIGTNGPAVIQINVNCPTASILNIVEVVLTANSEVGQTIQTQYRYTDGTFVGSLQSDLVFFTSGTNPVVSRYNTVTGPQGSASIPTDSSTMRMISSGGGALTFQFDPLSDSFKYLRTNTLYNNNTADITDLLAAANTAPYIAGSGDYFYADFNVGTSDNYLYLIWDFRNSNPVNLCYSKGVVNIQEICCECDPCSEPCKSWSFRNVGEGSAQIEYTDCNEDVQTLTIAEGATEIICALSSVIPEVLSGTLLITVVQECGCPN
jgi:hypothetical protein